MSKTKTVSNLAQSKNEIVFLNELAEYINESHLYPSITESILRTALLGVTIGTSTFCLNPNEVPSAIGVVILCYTLSILSEMVPKLTRLTNLLNRIYMVFLFAWIVAITPTCGKLLAGQSALQVEALRNMAFFPFVIYSTDAFTYILWDRKNNASNNMPETNLKK